MTNADNMEVVSSAVVALATCEVPTVGIVSYEQYRSRSLENVAADDDTQIGWRKFHEA
ncbi:hypothetical protein [Thermomonas fusca]|uniref:hypothetical protein n=1 Tax=Thermomonas fusca TaxID=215690 RepID=UPI001486BE06|nr:hypothetical protein [Thermomonas fusca]